MASAIASSMMKNNYQLQKDEMDVLGEFEAKCNKMAEFPDKFIINSLTLLADREKHDKSNQIVDFITNQLKMVAANRKVPLFFLMDSILKNVGGVYVLLFSRVVVDLYLHSMPVVQDKDRIRMVRLLGTWEKQRLFAKEQNLAMRSMAQRIMAQNSNPALNKANSTHGDDVILRKLLTKLQNDMGVHPMNHLSLDEVRHSNPQLYTQLLAYKEQQEASKAPKSDSSAEELLALLKVKKAEVQSHSKTEPRKSANSKAKVLSILQKMKKIPDLTKEPSGPPSKGAISINPSKLRREINVQSLYASLPLVCRQSGVRFKDQAKLDDHLDFIFKYNRSQRERAKGGTSRSWYPNKEQWVTDFKALGETSLRGETSGSFFEQTDKVARLDDDASAKPSCVVADDSVPKCRICGEQFVKFWDEDEEEWMYKNTVHGKIHSTSNSTASESIFHQHCYAAATSESKILSAAQLAPGTPNSPNLRSGSWSRAGQTAKRNLGESLDPNASKKSKIDDSIHS